MRRSWSFISCDSTTTRSTRFSTARSTQRIRPASAAAVHAQLLGQARLDVVHDGDRRAAALARRERQRHAQDRRAERQHDRVALDAAARQRAQPAHQEADLVEDAGQRRAAPRRRPSAPARPSRRPSSRAVSRPSW